ncbi:helix-turn-helix domain-containing protein [Myroides indicus]|uniref:DNA-binding XRE family transcriptional regulator n=1 Tax=Myroides indicus TaxID=1323422 RepID=A0A4R7EQ89_9FLAO|nr:helix-turn-helix transcriptional regulator [Myroides indicus]TDS54598.1 DNA-binding XRE family transcriptional regulator [Myroides indicus]
MKNVEEKIRNIRELKNYTQEYMAEQLGMTQAAYSKIENGSTRLTMSKLEDIAKVFEMDVSDLVAYDTQGIFNSFNTIKESNINSNITKSDEETLKKLYEDKIILLEKLLHNSEKELKIYRDRFGDLM